MAHPNQNRGQSRPSQSTMSPSSQPQSDKQQLLNFFCRCIFNVDQMVLTASKRSHADCHPRAGKTSQQRKYVYVLCFEPKSLEKPSRKKQQAESIE